MTASFRFLDPGLPLPLLFFMARHVLVDMLFFYNAVNCLKSPAAS